MERPPSPSPTSELGVRITKTSGAQRLRIFGPELDLEPSSRRPMSVGYPGRSIMLGRACSPMGRSVRLGWSRFAETMISRLEEAGGVAVTNTPVEDLLMDGGTAVGVCMVDERESRASLVVT